MTHPLNMTVCATDGEQFIAVRYSSERASPSLFHSTSVKHLHALCLEDERIKMIGDEAFLVLSEPWVDLPGLWEEVLAKYPIFLSRLESLDAMQDSAPALAKALGVSETRATELLMNVPKGKYLRVPPPSKTLVG